MCPKLATGSNRILYGPQPACRASTRSGIDRTRTVRRTTHRLKLMDSTTTLPEWIARDAMVVFHNSQGAPSQGRLLHLDHHQAAFDLPATGGLVQISEVLRNFQVLVKGRPV